MTIENAISAIGLLGVGGIVGTYFRMLWERRKTALLHQQEFKETRYKCAILLMYAALDFEGEIPLLRQHGRNFDSLAALMDEVRMEWSNMILFASEDVLVAVHAFIQKPSILTFRKAAIAMREDLWGGKISKSILGLDFALESPSALKSD
jgi:hypothetical protein